MEITQERLDQLKSQIKIEKPLGKLLQDSLVLGKQRKGMRLTGKQIKGMRLMAAAEARADYQEFGFDIKLLKISGRIYKNGRLDVVGSVFGIKIGHTSMDLSNAEVCFNPKAGKILSVKYCFSLQGKCLYTRGEIKGWFLGTQRWNKRIFCFP